MGSRYELELTIISAKDLKNVNWRQGKNRPYVVVWIDPNNKKSSHVDEEGDTSPYWDEKLTIQFNTPIDESTLHVDIVHAGAAEGTKPLIGSAKLKLADFVDDVGLGSQIEKRLELKRPSGRPHGKVEVKLVVREPHDQYQRDPYQSSYGVPYDTPPSYAAPPPAGYSSSYGAPASYEHRAPEQAGYGQGPYGQPAYGQQGGYDGGQQEYVEKEEEKKSKFGGMGTGLAIGAVAGVLGGVALTEGFHALHDSSDDSEDDKEDKEEEDDEVEDRAADDAEDGAGYGEDRADDDAGYAEYGGDEDE